MGLGQRKAGSHARVTFHPVRPKSIRMRNWVPSQARVRRREQVDVELRRAGEERPDDARLGRRFLNRRGEAGPEDDTAWNCEAAMTTPAGVTFWLIALPAIPRTNEKPKGGSASASFVAVPGPGAGSSKTISQTSSLMPSRT